MPGTCRPERALVSVHRTGRRDPPHPPGGVSSPTLQPETEDNMLLSLRGPPPLIQTRKEAQIATGTPRARSPHGPAGEPWKHPRLPQQEDGSPTEPAPAVGPALTPDNVLKVDP